MTNEQLKKKITLMILSGDVIPDITSELGLSKEELLSIINGIYIKLPEEGTVKKAFKKLLSNEGIIKTENTSSNTDNGKFSQEELKSVLNYIIERDISLVKSPDELRKVFGEKWDVTWRSVILRLRNNIKDADLLIELDRYIKENMITKNGKFGR